MADGPSRFFDAIAGRYERVYALPSTLTRDRMRHVLRALPPAPARVLDLGVGPGRELPALLDAGHEVTGVDVSREMLDRCARRSRPVPLVEADFWQPLPFEDASFEAAVALHGTLAHPPDDEAMARLGAELGRVVAPGGVLVIEVPSPAWLEELAALPATDDRVVKRTGPSSGIFEDRTAGASIEVRLLSAEQWSAALSPAWAARAEPLGELEWLVVGTRTR